MSEVKRYKLATECGVAGHMESLSGKWVKYEEYAALQQQLSATTNSLTKAQEALKSAGIEADTVQAGVMELVSRMNQVVTEMSAMAESRNRLGEFILEEIDADYPLNMELETPAADAYLNAVRAEGAEMFGNRTIAVGEEENDSAIVYAGEQALLFAAQLRAGNAGKDGV
ncbi:hypothetical protein [Pantoea sp. GM_Pan_4]|uniref:hypothetical protein n=1 Tax=Pantoea sp. GM_Pan_4 TaxID=2937389 RepID=UPI00226ADFDB|nr:hypothetical protein [Pantoea sp. GM_Pan_4]